MNFNKLKIIIPKEIIDYSHRGIDIDNNMNRDAVSALLIMKAKYEYLEDGLDIIIVNKRLWLKN